MLWQWHRGSRYQSSFWTGARDREDFTTTFPLLSPLSKLINSFKGICLSRLIKRVFGMKYTKDEGVAIRRARINERRERNLGPSSLPFHHRSNTWRALFDKSRSPPACKQGRLNKSNYLREGESVSTEGKIISRGRIFRCFRYRSFLFDRL